MSFPKLKKLFDDKFKTSIHQKVNENANVNTDTPMGAMLEIGSEASREYYLNEIITKKYSELHKSGNIHIHDLDFYGLCQTCVQIDVDSLFEKGFNTGHGYIRPPKDIKTYSALACIILQSSQNNFFGGQSIPNFDTALAKGVRKTFERYKVSIKNDAAELGVSPCDEQIEKMAWEKTERDTFQAMEALIYNLNSMHSRAGAQVPFCSINYGLDTSVEGRMLIKNLLLATEKGLGKGETPIFPIQIFRLKSGINLNVGDPNEDLFKMACRILPKRLFPNFSFQDAPFNLKYYDESRPETHVAYMGCNLGDEYITYKINGNLFVEASKRAFSRLQSMFGSECYGVTTYVDVSGKGIEIFDSTVGGFVEMKKILMNPDRGNWKRITFTNGRLLDLTEDHPLPIIGKGRTLVKDVSIGDEINIIENQYSEETMSFQNPWLHGVILCDGAYGVTTIISLGMDERDIAEKLISELNNIGLKTKIVEQRRGTKGNYLDICVVGEQVDFRKHLMSVFGGVKKIDRRIPVEIFNSKRDDRLAFMAGMIDADGGVKYKQHKNGMTRATVQIGSTNRELAIGQLTLAQSLGIPARIYQNRYKKNSDKVRYRIEFLATEELLNALVSAKKKPDVNIILVKPIKHSIANVASIEFLTNYGKESYDVETVSDMFDLSGVSSHNCRTRVLGNVYDPTQETTYGRGNLSFTSINLPRLAIENKEVSKFMSALDGLMDDVHLQLLERFEIQRRRKVKNYPFAFGQGIWLGSDKLKLEDEVDSVIRHGTLSIGFVGLAETLKVLTGKHHGESEESQKLGLEIIGRMKAYCDALSEKYKMNFSVIATPAESLAGRFASLDKAKFGEMEWITDKGYYTNSFHIPVDYKISMKRKIDLEAPYHALCLAGHISYVEMKDSSVNNPEAYQSIIRYMAKKGIGYGSINSPVDRDNECGFEGVIGDCCPQCGRKETKENPFYRIKRITGYLVSDVKNWNHAKQLEQKDRIKHDTE